MKYKKSISAGSNLSDATEITHEPIVLDICKTYKFTSIISCVRLIIKKIKI